MKARPVEPTWQESRQHHSERLAHGGKPKTGKKTIVISMMAFAIMNVTTIVSLRGLPSQAEYGLTSIFYYVFAAVVFLDPDRPRRSGAGLGLSQAGRRVSLGRRGVRAAVGLRRHLLPVAGDRHLVSDRADLRRGGAGLYLVAAELRQGAWPSNKLYTIVVLLAVYWFVTLFTFRGMKRSSQLELARRPVRHHYSRGDPDHSGRRSMSRWASPYRWR